MRQNKVLREHFYLTAGWNPPTDFKTHNVSEFALVEYPVIVVNKNCDHSFGYIVALYADLEG